MHLTVVSLIAIPFSLLFFACSTGVDAPGARTEVSLSGDCYEEVQTPVAETAIAGDSTFSVVSDSAWDETAVRQVLKVFALGGFASDAQISTWADMNPGLAIQEMLTLETTNQKLSAFAASSPLQGMKMSLGCMSDLWTSAHSANRVPADLRENMSRDNWGGPEATYLTLTGLRGANTFRQRMGLFETNYHLAVNLETNVTGRQILAYYDLILDGLQEGKSYDEVLADAALSAAVATQYGHRENVYRDLEFYGNEDFAREFYQLFFGILGFSPTNDYDFSEHETVTIPQTARALTDIRVIAETTSSGDSVLGSSVQFGSDYHYQPNITSMGESFSGSNADAKIRSMASHAITTSESLGNLPIIIIETLADNNMSDDTKDGVRALWNGIASKNLLEFLRKYAISTYFHSSERVKYYSPQERNLVYTNLITLSDVETYNGLYLMSWMLSLEDSRIFRPAHNVFGSVTGLEAASSPNTFKSNFRRSVDRYWLYARSSQENIGWRKNWQSIIPQDSSGGYNVVHVGEWLWQRLIADGLDNFGPLERYHVYTLLGAGLDLAYVLDPEDPLRVYSLDELNAGISEPSSDLGIKLAEIREGQMLLGSSDSNILDTQNYRVGAAVNFITTTPYAYAQQGRVAP